MEIRERDTSIGVEPSRPYVVGIGASAGGLEAIEAFFDKIPPGSGAAYVVVQHLSPDFKSLMDQLLARHTSLTILRAEESMPVEADHIYLIPPRTYMRIHEGRLTLTEQEKDRSVPLPIDIFFKSLAEDAGDRAIGVILSGTGSDGSRGVSAIKAAGGVVLVQDVGSAKFDGMPVAAAATGSADIVAPPWDMARVIIGYIETPSMPLSPSTPRSTAEPLIDIVNAVKKAKNIDFSQYKERTLLRRIARRVGILQLQSLEEYRNLLLDSRSELEYLVQDLLIGVTEFFRDEDTFRRLEGEIPKIATLAGTGQLRIWVAGCSSGEEAYSIALLLEEHRRRTGHSLDFKIFATDVNERAIARASEGTFPLGACSNMTPDMVDRYFDRSSDGIRIRREVRNNVVFAHHNLVKDPPFTRIHLVTCRNLLIYIKPEVQERILHNLHFSLVHNGVLFLGPSESTQDIASEFDEIDSKHKLFRKRRDVRLAVVHDHQIAPRPTIQPPKRRVAPHGYLDFDRVCSAFVSEFVPTCLILDDDGTIVHSFGDLGHLLSVKSGRASLNALQMVERDVRAAISTAMHRARSSGEPVTYEQVHLTAGRDGQVADITVKYLLPNSEDEMPLHLVMVGQPEVATGDSKRLDATTESSDHIDRLENELQHTKENLQATIEELETTNEELQSTNEEMLASNEELQSTNEELHSVNEELYTVNAEHQKKIEELTEVSGDMENLLRSTEIGTVFVDEELRIRKYTPQAADFVNLVESDIGRPIGHLSSSLSGVNLESMAKSVIEAGIREELRARDTSGQYRLVRVLPYRGPGQNQGAVITLIDIDTVVEAQTSLQESEDRFQQIVENLDQVLWMCSPDGSEILYMSPLYESLWGRSVQESYDDGLAWTRAIHPDDRQEVIEKYQPDILANGEFDVEYRINGPKGLRWIHAKAFPIRDTDGQVLRIAGFAQDITNRRLQEERLRELADELESKAQTDALTGLYNRRGLDGALTRELSRATRAGQSVAAILVDVDDFKQVNDSLGHATGDVVLQGIARRMHAVLRPSDLIARVGGDEFMIVLPETRLAEAVHVSERLRLAVRDEPMEVSGRQVQVTASFGVAIVPLSVVSIEEVLDATRQALGTSKRQGKNRVVAATDGQGLRCTAEASDADIELLTREGSITALAQAIRNVVSGDITGYEMLSRGPAGIYENPGDFFRLSHEKNMLTLVDFQCLRSCLQASAPLNGDGLIHVNIFPSTLVDSPIERIVNLMQDAGGPERFCLELSEQQFLGAPAYLTEAVTELRRFGVQVAIDDVGYGRSSIEALVMLEPDIIKIAREFVMNSDVDPRRRRGLERLTTASKALSSSLVAEGVETEGERAVLMDLGIHRAQGFLWDRPGEVEQYRQN